MKPAITKQFYVRHHREYSRTSEWYYHAKDAKTHKEAITYYLTKIQSEALELYPFSTPQKMTLDVKIEYVVEIEATFNDPTYLIVKKEE